MRGQNRKEMRWQGRKGLGERNKLEGRKGKKEEGKD